MTQPGERKPLKARFPLPELTGDRFPLPVNTGRVDGPSTRLVETRALETGHPSTLVVETGLKSYTGTQRPFLASHFRRQNPNKISETLQLIMLLHAGWYLQLKPVRGTTWPRGQNVTLIMVDLGAFSVAKEAAVTGTFPLPNATLIRDVIQRVDLLPAHTNGSSLVSLSSPPKQWERD